MKQTLSSKSGNATAVEYALIAAVVVMAILGAIVFTGKALEKSYHHNNDALLDAMGNG